MEEIEIIVNPDGSLTIEGKNFVDADCKKLTKELEDDLGVVVHVTEKPEMKNTRTRTSARKVVR